MDQSYKPRLLDQIIERKLQSSGGVVLQGARFVGKTTTALAHARSSVRLDSSPQMIEQATLAPAGLLVGETPRVIDEWQLAPDIWNAIRYEIDQRGVPGQFILTGSAAPDDDKTRHTGAGRLARLALKPMTLFESGDSTGQVDVSQLFESQPKIAGIGGPTLEEYAQLIVRGGWPALVPLPPQAAQDALIDYLENVASVDLRTLASPPDPVRMSALIRAIARNTATEASLATLASETELLGANISLPSVRKYLDQLTQIFILEELESWKTHLRSSIQMRVKPKWHFTDPSLSAAALRCLPEALMSDLETMGLLFESLAIRDLRVYAQYVDAQVTYYRDSTDLEVDVILQRHDGTWSAVEVKLGSAKAIDEASENFKRLKQRLPEKTLANLASCIIITAGQNSFIRPDGIAVVALGHLGAGIDQKLSPSTHTPPFSSE